MSRIYLGINDVLPEGSLEEKLDAYLKYLEKEKKEIWK